MDTALDNPRWTNTLSRQMSELFLPLPNTDFPRAWRLGVTSYVYPTDLQTNISILAGRVQDIELVLFDTPKASNFPSAVEIERMAALAAEHDLTYTVHFPINHRVGSADRKERHLMARQMTELIKLTAPLRPHGYITHLEGIHPADPADTVRAWQRDCLDTLKRVLDCGVDASRMCAENLDFPFEWSDAITEPLGMSVCIDIGHLWRNGVHELRHIDRYRRRTRVIHLHGENAGEDHISLTYVNDARMELVDEVLQDFDGVVTLELFEEMQVRYSIERLGQHALRCAKQLGDGTIQQGRLLAVGD
jgi:sugar phosphate isomerase/epimerase